MSESGDYSPGVWAGHDFSSARRTYDSHVGRMAQNHVLETPVSGARDQGIPRRRCRILLHGNR